MKVKRWSQVLIILIPLTLALPFLLFSIFTEWWSHTDNLVIDKNQKLIDSNLNTHKNFVKKKYQIKFYKLNNLFSNCYEYKWIDVIEPASTSNSTLTTSISSNCLNQNKCLQIPCFNCKKEKSCYIDATKQCNFIPDCPDETDELDINHECQPIQTKFFQIKYYDKINMCYREKYNYIDYIKKLIENKFNLNLTKTDNEMDNKEFEVLNLNMLTLFSLLLCAVLTIFCFFILLFIRCCSYKTDSTISAKSEYYDNYNKRHHYFVVETNTNNNTSKRVQNINDDDEEDNDDDSDYNSSGCCKCTYYLCPFIFYTIFVLLAFLACLFGLGVYIYLNFSIYKTIFLNNQLYQLNTWLIDLNRVGMSFYSLCISCFLYALTFLLSIYITCRIQLSPEWRSRYSETYEILQMHEVSPSSTTGNNKKKRIYKD